LSVPNVKVIGLSITVALLANPRGSYWIPGASWVKFVVIDCFYRLFLRVVTNAASLEKAV
jgi:hypothetical protein